VPYISESSIQEVKDRLDAVAVVSEYVKLERRGGRWWACCPFHQEKTASFTVNPDLKTYYCFGCHKGDTVVKFVQEMDRLTFPETMEQLAGKTGIELVYERSSGGDIPDRDEAKKKAKEEIFELYQRISGTFHHFLLKKPEAEAAKQYIISRGTSIEMIERFRLGYAPADRYWLHTFLSQKKGYSGEFLQSSGLFSSRYPGVSLFSGRLMFPIADRQGRTVAFGGRFLPGQADGNRAGEQPPKYINSPETQIYKKGETLFAIDLALPEVRRTKTAYIAEGYTDVIALHQAGITSALAPLGTAFTDDQAKLLGRWAEKVILFFDTDGAGQDAAVKAIFACRRNGLACAVVTHDASREADAKDPADILKQYGARALKEKANNFAHDFDYLLGRAKSLRSANNSVQGKARAVAFLFPYVDLLDSGVARDSCVEAIADAFGLLPAAVAEDYRRYALGQGAGRGDKADKAKEETHSRIRMNDELALLVAMAANHASPSEERLFPAFRAALEIHEIHDQRAKEIFIALEECVRYGETGMDEILARVSSPELRGFIVEKSASGEFSVKSRRLMEDGIRKIKGRRLERKQEEIIIKLREVKNEGQRLEANGLDVHGLEIRELLAEKMRIDDELNSLKQGR